MNEESRAVRRPTSRLRRFGGRVILLLFGSLLGLLTAEILLHVLAVAYPLPYYPDPYCGSRLRPGFQAWFTKEGRAYVTVNRAGFRDVEHSQAKPPNTIRIAVLGDSFAEAVQVPLEQTFWSVLQAELERKRTFGERRVEVLNFGISGHGTAQQLQILRHYVWAYQPDIVLLAFFAGNDVRNNSQELEPDQARPFFRIEHGELVLDDRFLQHPDYLKAQSPWVRSKVALINGSHLLQLLNEWKTRLASGTALPRQEGGVQPDLQALREDSDERWQEAWRVTERLLTEMQRECAAHQARLYVVLVTESFQVHPDPQYRQRIQRENGIANLDVAEARIESLGHREGFAAIPLAGFFRDYAEKHQAYLHGFSNAELGGGHWNALGHRLAGERIAEAIDKQK